MPGIFSKASRPLRPGAYFNWNVTQPATVPPAIGSIVAIPFTSDWGPFKVATLVSSFQEYLAVYGPTVGTPGYNAVWQAFQGEGGFEGRYGAGAVLCYRMGAAAAAKATHTFTNTTPASALRLDAVYEGTYGNNLRVTTQDHAADSTLNELLVYNGTQLLETYVYADTNIADLVAQINAVSDWVRATLLIDGIALTAVSAAALTGGNDGSTVLAGDWTTMESALESEQFGLFVPYGLVDSTILASLKTWAAGASSGGAGLNTKGKRFEVVLGGSTAESMATAVTRSGTFNDGNFVNLGRSSFTDENLLDVNRNPVTVSGAQFAARVAGVLAGRGESMSATFARFPGVTLVDAPTESEISQAFQGGVLVFARDSDPDAPVHIEKALTTFTKGVPGGAAADPNFPYRVFRNPKFMRTMQNVEVEWTTWANRAIIGKLQVNNKTRDAAIAELANRLRARESVGVIQPGWTVAVDPNPPPSDDDEFIQLLVGIRFGRSVEQVFITVNAG